MMHAPCVCILNLVHAACQMPSDVKSEVYIMSILDCNKVPLSTADESASEKAQIW